MIDLVQTFENYATAAEYEFAYGRKTGQNWVLTEDVDLDSGESVILMTPMIETGEIVNSFPQSWSVETQIWLGKKFDTDNESGTYAQLDETGRQKYNRRLKTLRTNIETYLKAVFCGEDDLELTAVKISTFINQFDENLDFIGATITFNHDSRVS